MNFISRALVILLVQAIPCSVLAEVTGGSPLPPLQEVLRQVLAQAQKEQGQERIFDQTYSYTRTKVTEYLNSKGEVKKRKERMTVRNPTQVAAEFNDDADAVETNGGTARASSEAKDRAYERKDFTVNEDLLNRFHFTLVGREEVNGRPALVITFKPANKELSEHSLKERFINRTAGKVWVDETDYFLARAYFYLTQKVNVIGGLVGAVQGFTCNLDRQRTEDGLWFTRTMNWHLEGRELFFHRTIDYHEERTNVRKANEFSLESAGVR